MNNYVEPTLEYNLDEESCVEDRILYYSENHNLQPWALVSRVEDDTGENNEDIRKKMREMLWDWELQIRLGGYMDIDRHD